MDWSMDWTKKIALLVPPAGFAARPHIHEQNTAVSEEVIGHMHVTQLCFNSAAADGSIWSA